MKLAVIGGGSTSTAELVDGLVRMTRRMLDLGGHAAGLTATGSLDEAVEGADTVIVQLRVRGRAARMVDESLPLPCGCLGHETTGFGGRAKPLRTVNGVTPLPMPPLDPLYPGLVAHASAYEDLVLDAALHGGRERVSRALLAHPLVDPAGVAEKLTDRMIDANRDFLAWA